MADGSGDTDTILRMVEAALSAPTAMPDPDDPAVQGFAGFGLAPSSSLATDRQLRKLEAWRASLRIPPNSAFLDGTLLQTVEWLLGPAGPMVLTPVTLWELTTFIDALICFDHLYCIENPQIDVARFNRLLGDEVLTAIPDPGPGGMLHQIAADATVSGLANMSVLRTKAGNSDPFGAEVQAVTNGWQAVLGPDLPNDAPFNTDGLDIVPGKTAVSGIGFYLGELQAGTPLSSPASAVLAAWLSRRQRAGVTPRPGQAQSSASLIDGSSVAVSHNVSGILGTLLDATRIAPTPFVSLEPPSLADRQRLAAIATYRTYVNQGVANALAIPYLPGTLRMPFRRLFVERAAQVHDQLATVAVADRIFAQQQPASPLRLPFFTAAVLQRSASLDDVWTQMGYAREKSASFRGKRAEWDALLERSEVSGDALRLQAAIRDQGIKLADLAGVAQQSVSVGLGVVAQTSIVPLAGALKVGVDAAQGVGRGGGWTRVWRRLFHQHEYFLAQTNSQAIALTNAMPQIQLLWEMPNIGGYLSRFASTTQEIGRILRDS